jgi:hypothetical protein
LNSLRSVEAKSIHAPNRKPELAEFETETEPEFDSKKVNIPSASLPVNQKQDGPSKQRIQVYWQSRPHPEKKKQSTVAASLLVRPNKKKIQFGGEEKSICQHRTACCIACSLHVHEEAHHETSRPLLAAHVKTVHEHTYFIYSSTTTRCAATTRHPATRALYQPCRALRLLVTRPHRLYVSLAVRREYSSPSHSSSTSTSPCIPTTRHPAARAIRQPCCAPRVLVSRPQRLYIDYAVRRQDVVFWAYDYFDYSSRLVSTRKLVENGSRDINN